MHIFCDAGEKMVAFPKTVLLVQAWEQQCLRRQTIILKVQYYEKHNIHWNSGNKTTIYEGKHKPHNQNNNNQQ